MAVIGAIVQISWNCNNWQGFPKCLKITSCPAYQIPQSQHIPDCKFCNFSCRCITYSGHGYITKNKWGAEWWSFLPSNFNTHNNRIYSYAPFGARTRVEDYITSVQGKGIILLISTDIHNAGRKFVGVYGKGAFHGITHPPNRRPSLKGRYPLRDARPLADATIKIFDDTLLSPPPLPQNMENIWISRQLNMWFAPTFSGEIYFTTHFPQPLLVRNYLLDNAWRILDRHRRSSTFPILIVDGVSQSGISVSDIKLEQLFQDAMDNSNDEKIKEKIKKIREDLQQILGQAPTMI